MDRKLLKKMFADADFMVTITNTKLFDCICNCVKEKNYFMYLPAQTKEKIENIILCYTTEKKLKAANVVIGAKSLHTDEELETMAAELIQKKIFTSSNNEALRFALLVTKLEGLRMEIFTQVLPIMKELGIEGMTETALEAAAEEIHEFLDRLEIYQMSRGE